MFANGSQVYLVADFEIRNFKIRNKMSKENKTSDKQQNGNDFIADVSNSTFKYDAMKKQTNGKVAIRKGCPNQQCFCTGSCQEIIGWRDKLPNEH